jgi:energy-coupling factor transporter ATP-binding protein EcfA2
VPPCRRCAAAPAGPSGAGKSTLLNALACRLDKGSVLEGKVRLNGQIYELAHLKRIARWVGTERQWLSVHSRWDGNLLRIARWVGRQRVYTVVVCVAGDGAASILFRHSGGVVAVRLAGLVSDSACHSLPATHPALLPSCSAAT